MDVHDEAMTILFVARGGATVEAPGGGESGEPVPLAEGDCLTLPPGQPFRVTPSSDDGARVLDIRLGIEAFA